jgi:hypothetical protein
LTPKDPKEHLPFNQRIEKKIDETLRLLDGYVKSQEDFKQEFEIMKYKVSKIKEVIKEKLGVEIE